MARIFNPLLFLLAGCVENQLIRQIQFLKAENEMLRKRVPKKRIFLATEEKKRLIDLGKPIGPGLRHLITVVRYESFLRWIRQDAKGEKPKKMGRPRKAAEIRELILRFAKENGWGYTRILGELKKLGIFSVSKGTVKNVLKENGFDPGPKRGKGTWDEFLKIHFDTLWQCDFFSKKIWTPTGLRQYFVLVFLHVGSRKVFVTQASRKPDAAWMREQATAFLSHVEAEGMQADFVIRDRDGMFVKDFEQPLKDSGIDIKVVSARAANMNAFVERWIQSIKHECLDNFIVFGEDHFNYLISEYVDYYLTVRLHQNMGNKPLTGDWPTENGQLPDDSQIVCRERLGGLLKHYERKAA